MDPADAAVFATRDYVLWIAGGAIAVSVVITWALWLVLESRIEKRDADRLAEQRERDADLTRESDRAHDEIRLRDAERERAFQAFVAGQSVAALQAAESRGAMGERVAAQGERIASLERSIASVALDVKSLLSRGLDGRTSPN